MKLFKAPEDTTNLGVHTSSVFLAGAIDMGAAEHWQQEVAGWISDREVVVFDPRRDDWDSSWKQDKDDPQFKEQVEWELTHIERSDFVIFYFPKDSKAPISFLELGLCLGKGKNCLIYVHPEFYRKGNIDITAARKSIPVYSDLEQFKRVVRETIL